MSLRPPQPYRTARPTWGGATGKLHWSEVGGLCLGLGIVVFAVAWRVGSWTEAGETQAHERARLESLARARGGQLLDARPTPQEASTTDANTLVEAARDTTAPTVAVHGATAPAPTEVDPTPIVGGGNHLPPLDLDAGGFGHNGGVSTTAPATRASASNRPWDGAFVEHHPDGSLALEGEFDDGQRTGHWTAWHPDGTLQSEGDYAAGQRVGRWRTYHSSGQVRSEGNFQGGDRVGAWVVYYSSGQVKEQGTFELDLREGPWQFFDRFGDLEARTGFYHYGRKY